VRGKRHGGLESKAMAILLLAIRWSPAEIARLLGVNARTVRTWRASPDGHLALERAREQYRGAFKDALVKARRTILEALPEAAEILVETLHHAQVDARLRAAFGIMDRAGLHPRAAFDPPPEGDTSRLTDEQLAQYLFLCRLMEPHA
jgi:PAS domain-containing protein